MHQVSGIVSQCGEPLPIAYLEWNPIYPVTSTLAYVLQNNCFSTDRNAVKTFWTID